MEIHTNRYVYVRAVHIKTSRNIYITRECEYCTILGQKSYGIISPWLILHRLLNFRIL
jgi:hypothetical protein